MNNCRPRWGTVANKSRATAPLGLNTSDPEAVQPDPAKNLDQSQSPLPSTAAVNAKY